MRPRAPQEAKADAHARTYRHANSDGVTKSYASP